ncbi:MAG: NAD(P)H-hydrate dehydratase, partial [Arenicella sp.]|nr:NAD(P)H-hydrate dehydratase [Arenicella sp.]
MQQRIYTGVAAKEIDRQAIEEHGVAGFALMSEAGNKAFELLQERFPRPARLLVLCGSGNNGGDGYILASCALIADWQVQLVAAGEPKTADAKTACQQFVDDGGEVLEPGSLPAEAEFDVVVDALLGIGLSGSPTGVYAELIDLANSLDAMVFALDVPSGIDADTGAVFPPAVRAEMTATFIVPKVGLMTGPATSYVGELHTVKLAVPASAIQAVESIATVVEPIGFAPRSKDSHKGNYGWVVVAGGDHGMFGAVLLSGKSALRTGAGKVTILSTDEHLDRPALHTPELMSAVFEGANSPSLQQADVIALGPGLGLGSWGKDVFETVIGLDKRLLIDADGLNHLAAHRGAAKYGNWVLTPHPGEAASLLDVDTSQVQADRPAAARQIARQYNSVCVLKGAGTLIATPDGELSLCNAGNPGMASAGMGDVLS